MMDGSNDNYDAKYGETILRKEIQYNRHNNNNNNNNNEL